MDNSVTLSHLAGQGDHKGSSSSGPGGFYKLKLWGTVRTCNPQGNFAHVKVGFRADSEINVDEYITKDRLDELGLKKDSPVSVEFITSSVRI